MLVSCTRKRLGLSNSSNSSPGTLTVTGPPACNPKLEHAKMESERKANLLVVCFHGSLIHVLVGSKLPFINLFSFVIV